MGTLVVELPQKIKSLFNKKARYRGAYGGRGSGKSVSFARMCLVYALEKKRRILCAREIQNSIKDSVLQELINQVDTLGLNEYFDYGVNFIRCKNGSEFLFKGLKHNYREIKSTSDVDICWIEEAEAVSENSWQVLIPTIRNKGSEIWLTWNPENEESPTHRRFVVNPPKNSLIDKVNFYDNPWFPDELQEERRRDEEINPELYRHIWLGETLSQTDAQILAGKYTVEDFTVEDIWDGPYYGLDFGFSQDPTAAIKCWIFDEKIYVEKEAGKQGLELDETAEYIKEKIEGIENGTIYADSSRPESISYIKRNGLPKLQGVKKWPGSVEDGIKFVRSFKTIVIHPSCTNFLKECKYYSYKVDRLTNEVRTEIVDAHNHYIDALRYALSPLIKQKTKARIRTL